MCIRDRLARIVDEMGIDVFAFGILADFRTRLFPGSARLVELADRVQTCLLYTSDAADERSSVDLGGRRIIKKKKNTNYAAALAIDQVHNHETSRA